MELIVQPDEGITPLIKAIDGATKSIEIAVFRFDRADLQQALKRAVARGVAVQALISNTNRGGATDLRELEMDFLASGIDVARTADDLLRYHYKFMIVDRQTLHMLTFNFTHLDIGSSRSFGFVTRNPGFVREAGRLFAADLRRQSYAPEMETFLVSPLNARQELARFIEGAEQELLIYDPEISDPQMVRLLRERAKAGVEIRIIGRVVKATSRLGASGLMRMRFHTRAIIRDRRLAFAGSQGLRENELDRRREVGLILHNRHVVHSLVKVFEKDWSTLTPETGQAEEKKRSIKRARVLVKDLPLGPVVEQALKRALGDMPKAKIAGDKFEHRIEDALRATLEDSVSHMVKEAIQAEDRR